MGRTTDTLTEEAIMRDARVHGAAELDYGRVAILAAAPLSVACAEPPSAPFERTVYG